MYRRGLFAKPIIPKLAGCAWISKGQLCVKRKVVVGPIAPYWEAY